MNLIVVGAGGHAKSVLDAALSLKCFDKIAFLADFGENEVLGYPVIGKTNQAEMFADEYENAVVAVGNNEYRLKTTDKLLSMGFKMPALIHKTAYVSDKAQIGAGTVVLGNAFVNADSEIGRACIVNTAATVDHDCVVGNGVHISPNASLCGTVTVGDLSWICAGATVINNIRIGKSVTAGAGSVVIRDIPDTAAVRGVPAK